MVFSFIKARGSFVGGALFFSLLGGFLGVKAGACENRQILVNDRESPIFNRSPLGLLARSLCEYLEIERGIEGIQIKFQDDQNGAFLNPKDEQLRLAYRVDMSRPAVAPVYADVKNGPYYDMGALRYVSAYQSLKELLNSMAFRLLGDFQRSEIVFDFFSIDLDEEQDWATIDIDSENGRVLVRIGYSITVLSNPGSTFEDLTPPRGIQGNYTIKNVVQFREIDPNVTIELVNDIPVIHFNKNARAEEVILSNEAKTSRSGSALLNASHFVQPTRDRAIQNRELKMVVPDFTQLIQKYIEIGEFESRLEKINEIRQSVGLPSVYIEIPHLKLK